ncbi:hypothetical protein TNCV_4634111 [Trichonephila clavipes]|nr:hypothetical protein TNCV_4634111 [Trichonephila clavipes]
MVSGEAEFAVGNIEKLFKKVRQNTRVKNEKWAKYYNKRRCDVNIRSQGFRSSEFGERRGEQGKKTSLIGNQGDRREQTVNKRKRSRVSKESLVGLHNQQHKKTRQEVIGCKRRIPPSWSAGPERKKTRRPERETHKRGLSSSATSTRPLKKRFRESKESLQKRRASSCNLHPRSKVTKEDCSRPSGRAVQAQGGPVRYRREPFRRSIPYNQRGHSKQQGRQQPELSQRNGRSSPNIPGQSQHSRQQDRQEPNGISTSRKSESLEVHIGNVKERSKEL